MNLKQALFGERSITKVAAVYDDYPTALAAAGAAQRDAALSRQQITVIGPSAQAEHPDEVVHRALVPENHSISRTALRAHLTLGLSGAALAALVYAALAVTEHPAIGSTPVLSLVAMLVLGTQFGLMAGGALTLRPDQGWLFTSLRQTLARGHWAVVAHPFSEAQASAALARLAPRSRRTLRSF